VDKMPNSSKEKNKTSSMGSKSIKKLTEIRKTMQDMNEKFSRDKRFLKRPNQKS
jgi:hypothetical protein